MDMIPNDQVFVRCFTKATALELLAYGYVVEKGGILVNIAPNSSNWSGGCRLQGTPFEIS